MSFVLPPEWEERINDLVRKHLPGRPVGDHTFNELVLSVPATDPQHSPQATLGRCFACKRPVWVEPIATLSQAEPLRLCGHCVKKNLGNDVVEAIKKLALCPIH